MKQKIKCHYYFMPSVLGIVLFLANNALAMYPWIEIPPVSQAVPQGGTAALTVSMSGTLPITYKWNRNFESTNYYEVTLDSTNCTLLLTNLTPADACVFLLHGENADGSSQYKEIVVGVIASGMATNGFALTVYGTTNCLWTVNCTTNIANPDWFNVTKFNIPVNFASYTYVDLQATNLSRFYQVIPTVY